MPQTLTTSDRRVSVTVGKALASPRAFRRVVGIPRRSHGQVSKLSAERFPVIDVADRFASKIETAFLRLVQVVKDRVVLKDLAEKLASGDPTGAEALIDVEAAMEEVAQGRGLAVGETSLQDVLQATFQAGALAEMETLADVPVEVVKRNPCHEPAGSSIGGQFCSTGTSTWEHVTFSAAVRNKEYEKALEYVKQNYSHLFHPSLKRISFMAASRHQSGADGLHIRNAAKGESYITIRNKREPPANFVSTLVHELTHVQQHASGRASSLSTFQKESEAYAAGSSAFTRYLKEHVKKSQLKEGEYLSGGCDQIVLTDAAVADLLGEPLDNVEKATKKAPKLGAELSFNLLNPEAVAFLQGYTMNLIRQVSLETRLAIRDVILTAFNEGGHPYEQAREIRNLIGLTRTQAAAVRRFRQSLKSGDPTKMLETLQRALRDHRFDSTVLRAIQSQSTIPKAKADEMADRYYSRYLNYRARNIARTESIRASAAGQQELWRQAQQQGLLNSERTRRKWIVTRDDRTCQICAPIPSLNEDGVRLDEPFTTDIGDVDQPPLHPSCRCAVGLKFLKRKETT